MLSRAKNASYPPHNRRKSIANKYSSAVLFCSCARCICDVLTCFIVFYEQIKWMDFIWCPLHRILETLILRFDDSDSAVQTTDPNPNPNSSFSDSRCYADGSIFILLYTVQLMREVDRLTIMPVFLAPLYLVCRRTLWRSTNLILCYVMLRNIRKLTIGYTR